MAMAMREQQERRSPLPETTHPASADEPQMATITGGSAATSSKATAGDMAGTGSGAAAGEEERGLEGAVPDTVVRSSSSCWVALLPAVSSTNKVSIRSVIASPQFQRKPRTHVVRPAAPSSHWLSFKIPVLPPAPPAKKKASKKGKAKKKKCLLCGAAETPRWRTWPTDLRVVLCNACGIQVRKPGAVVPELVYLPHPAKAAATPAAVSVSELEQSVAPRQDIQPVSGSGSPAAALPKQVRVKLPPPATPTTTLQNQKPFPREIEDPESSTEPDSPILESLLDADIYLLKRTSPRRKKSPPPPPPTTTTAEPAAAAAAPEPGNRKRKRAAKRCCHHCGLTRTSQWRTGPEGEGTLCNACGVRYGRGELVPEYRPKASPSFNALVHSNQHREVLKIRRKLHNPAPPAPYLPVKPRMKRRKHKGQQQEQAEQQPAQVLKKRKEQNQQTAQAQPAVHEASDDDDDDERLPPEPALLKLRRQQKGKENRQPPQPAATQPRAAGNDMLQDLNLNLPPPPPPELPQAAAADNDMEQQHLLPLPQAQPRAGDDELMMSPPDPFLFDGPSAPMIIENKKAVIVIVIDED